MSIRLDMIGIVVKDIADSIRFYRTLGLEIPDSDGSPYHEIALDSGVRLSWNAESMMKDIDPDWVAPVGQRVSVAFLCKSPADVDSHHDALVAAGYVSHRAPWDAFWGHRYAQVSDPDANIVDLFAPLGA